MTFDNEFMEDTSSTVALPFVMGNSICEARSIEVTRIKLMTGMATVASMVEEKVGDGSKGKSSIDDDLSSTTVPVSEEVDNAMSVGPEPSAASDTSSIAGALNDLLNADVVFELCVSDPMDVDAVKTFEILASPLTEELRDDVLGISLEYDRVKGASTLEQMEVQETRVSAIRSMFLKDCVPLWGCVSICGRRPEMEDAVVAVPRFFDIPLWMLIGDCVEDGLIPSKANLPSHFFGVYDGHGGAQVANYCKERIHHALVDELTSWKGCLEGRSGCDWRRQWERVFNDCFMKVDDEVSGIARKGVQCAIDTSDGENSLWPNTMSDPVAPETVGSTAVVSVICSSHIIVANCGDSRAVLCRGKQALPLSMDHKPNREDEHARIEAAGGKVIQWNGYRVFGVLAMSRSIGDRYLKPWIIPEPEVRLIPRAREDECLILASDGLWDVMSNEEICEAARKRLLLWHKRNAAFDSPQKGASVDPASQAAAEYLSKLAIQRGSKDNITVVVVDLKPQRKFKTRTSS